MSLDITTLDRPAVIEVWAPSCSACRAMQPDLDAAAERYAGTVDLIMVNAAEDVDAIKALGARGTPTLVGVRDGVEVFRHMGRRSADELEGLFAALAEGTASPRVGFTDLAVRVGAGAILTIVGLIAGPAWPLVGIGAAIAIVGAFAWWRSGG